MQVQLKGVRDEPLAQPDPRFTLVVQPPVDAEQIVHQLVEVVVVTELHVAAEVPGEAVFIDDRARESTSGLGSLEEAPVRPAQGIEAPRGAQAGWSRTHDQNVDGLSHARAGAAPAYSAA